MHRIDAISAPLFISWQLTRDCDLACLHCCTASAPGKRLPDELNADEALRIADEIIQAQVPYVMLCGGEPLVVRHFLALARRFGAAGVQLKLETNGQQLDAALIEQLAALPLRSIQISLDGDTQGVYAAQRPGASLERAHAACRLVREAGLPLEITFAPTRLNIHQAQAVIDRAASFGAFRFNTGQLMRIGTAARLWERLEPSAQQYEELQAVLQRAARSCESRSLELCYTPFNLSDALRNALADPPATLLILPNGWVKVAAVLPFACADLRCHALLDAWTLYRNAWRDERIRSASLEALRNEAHFAQANQWQMATVA
ncbi:MAG TPA: radical SAM protein [Steroidobacteraceae bacterium]